MNKLIEYYQQLAQKEKVERDRKKLARRRNYMPLAFSVRTSSAKRSLPFTDQDLCGTRTGTVSERALVPRFRRMGNREGLLRLEGFKSSSYAFTISLVVLECGEHSWFFLCHSPFSSDHPPKRLDFSLWAPPDCYSFCILQTQKWLSNSGYSFGSPSHVSSV